MFLVINNFPNSLSLSLQGVGKTRLVTKYVKNSLHKDIGSTIAASFFTCKVMLDDVKIKLQVSTDKKVILISI